MCGGGSYVLPELSRWVRRWVWLAITGEGFTANRALTSTSKTDNRTLASSQDLDDQTVGTVPYETL